MIAYAIGVGHNLAEFPKADLADVLISDAVLSGDFVLAAQACGELHNLLVRKRGFARAEAASLVREYMVSATIVATTGQLVETALTLATRHQLQTFDAIILAAAAEAGCDILYSEDMQHGFEWCGVRVVNPFL